MTNSFLSEVTGRSSIPDHAMLISNMSTNKRGLGLQHPRCTAIPTLVLHMKRCIEYSSQGVWMGRTLDPVILPTAVALLFTNWKTLQSPAFLIFLQYAYDIAETCVHDGASDDKFEFLLHKSSPNSCRERTKKEAAKLGLYPLCPAPSPTDSPRKS